MTGKRRRAHGEGAVYKRADGMWVAAIDLGWIEGKRCRRVAYGKTEQAAIKKRDELKRRLQLGVDLSAPPRTLADWLTEWIDHVKANDGTRPSTRSRYRAAIVNHLVPGLGTVKLDKLNARQIQRFLTTRKGQSPASLIKIHGVLRAALSDAERMDLVPRNVAKAVRPASLSRAERRTLTYEEARAFMISIERDRLGPLFTLAITTGLRRGELLGLRWADVDLVGCALRVRQALQRVEGQLQFVEPKTHRSARPLPLSALSVKALERQRVRQATDRLACGSTWKDRNLVFASTIGTPLEPRNVNRRFGELRSAAGLDWLHLHDLRHAFATFLLDQGEEMRTVMELLGHSTMRLTADTYGHVLPSRARTAAESIDRALGGA